MMNKIKDILSNIWAYIVLIGGGAIAILLYILNVRNKELEAAQAKIAVANTQKDAELIEADINQRLANEDLADKDRAALQKSLDLLNQKRQTLSDPRTTDQAKEDYWDKQ